MMNKFSKIFLKIFPFLVLFVISLIPVYYTWGKLSIGGDTILPFNQEGVVKFLWQWYGSENGQYFTQNLVPLYLIYKVAGYFSLSLTAISGIIFFVLSFISGLAIYKLCKLIYKPQNDFFLFFPVAFYVISPAVLNGWHYCFIYAFAPWFVYFITKILINRKIAIIDIILANVVVFFASVDLPNPKYLFFLYLFAFAMFILALLLKMVSFKSVIRNWWKLLLFFLFSLYLLLPLVFFAFNYSPSNYGVHIKQNYSDTGLFMDQGSSTIDKMIQLHHSGINIDANDRLDYNTSKVTVFAGSIFFVCILLNLLIKKKNPNLKNELIFLTLVCLYLFFAVGPNPPLGFIYMALVSKIGLLAFLRTTAGGVFFLSIFYSVLLFGFIEKFKGMSKLAISVLLFLVLLITSYPLIDGKFYRNLDVVGNSTIDKTAYGVNLPAEYFAVKKVIDGQKIDGKLLNLKSNLAYINTDWGYFGPAVYNYLFNYYNIGFNNILSKPENHSVAFTLDDKSLIVDKKASLIQIKNTTTIADNDILRLTAVSPDDFIPHFWVPAKSYKEDDLLGDLPQAFNQKKLGEAIYTTDQNKLNNTVLDLLPESTQVQPVIEYKKINPTKYRVIIHQAKTVFPLIFDETFDQNWKIYSEKYTPQNNATLLEALGHYLKFEGNDNFQASKEEISNDIGLGLVSNLTTSQQDLNLDFVSKKMSGTIQNNNLADGSFFETWLQKPLLSDRRLVANGYANSWLIDPGLVCGQASFCQKNSNGSYDLEVVVEFLPQRVFWIGLLISLVAILASLFVVVLRRLKKE